MVDRQAIGGIPKMVVPPSSLDGLFMFISWRFSHLEMDDDWGYPYDSGTSGTPHMEVS